MNTQKHRPPLSSAFFVLDFDRCIGDTDTFHEVLEGVVEQETSISAASLRVAYENAKHEGRSFDTVRYVQDMLVETSDHVSWQQVLWIFITKAQTLDMLRPYAVELMTALDKAKLPYGILTYGDEAWQLAKLEAGGLLDVPHLVTHIEEKGRILTGWKHGRDSFVIPPALTPEFKPLGVDTILFLDDKAKSFRNIPDGVVGIHVLPEKGATPLSYQLGDLPSQVVTVHGLDGALKLLKENFGLET